MYKCLSIACLSLAFSACKTPALVLQKENREVPGMYAYASADTLNSGNVARQQFYADPNLRDLIELALKNNQELNITTQELQIAQNEVLARTGAYRPFVALQGGASVDKVGRYTLPGATVDATEIKPSVRTPDPLTNFMVGPVATWEVDIWRKLRNAKKAAVTRYQSSAEGRNFMVTNLVAEIATAYYELLGLDNELAIVLQNLGIQTNALQLVRTQKEATRVTELAVRRFEAQVLNTQGLQYGIQQRIVETENRINFLVGRFPQPVPRSSPDFSTLVPQTLLAGIPSQLLLNRPDIRRAELDLTAAKLDVQVARANFYPTLNISAGLGFSAYNPMLLLKAPESLIFSLAGALTGPLVNRYGITAEYNSATARQKQAVLNYERTVLSAYVEVANQLSNISNLAKSYDTKAEQVEALTQSVVISNTLFNAARADYTEVLFTQRDALESRFQLIETKVQQLTAMVSVYRALGGGWN